jgi:serine protease inhibitor
MTTTTYTLINHRDNITLSPTSLYDALAMATLIYDGAGILVEIKNPLGKNVDYRINYNGRAMLVDNLARMS